MLLKLDNTVGPNKSMLVSSPKEKGTGDDGGRDGDDIVAVVAVLADDDDDDGDGDDNDPRQRIRLLVLPSGHVKDKRAHLPVVGPR